MSVSFGRAALPTKIELIRIKRSLHVARLVHKILEDKREVLLRRLDEMIVEASKAREDLWKPIDGAYEALFDAYMRIGAMKLEATAAMTPPQIEVDVS
ncbi:MAG: V-type ATP synthase subunit D, partial [Nitrososphaerota archaeon]